MKTLASFPWFLERRAKLQFDVINKYFLAPGLAPNLSIFSIVSLFKSYFDDRIQSSNSVIKLGDRVWSSSSVFKFSDELQIQIV